MSDSAPTPTRKQMNVRLPVDLIARLDARRNRKDLSRDVFVERALEYALAHNPDTTAPAVATAPGRRTVRR